MEVASSKDIEEIREELTEEGYVRNRKKKNSKKKPTKPVLDKYLASDGTEIFVGKNNKQNDYLTTKFSRRDEIWLHTKDIPGSTLSFVLLNLRKRLYKRPLKSLLITVKQKILVLFL